jgi:small-conductance mechanosensitive channel
LKNPAKTVFFEDFGDNSLAFDLTIWVHAASEGGMRAIRSDLRFAIDKSFAESGVVIAFPQRDVHLDGEVVVRRVEG